MRRSVGLFVAAALVASSLPSRAQPVDPADQDAAGAAAFGAVVGGVLGGLAGAALTRKHRDAPDFVGGRRPSGGEGRAKGGGARAGEGGGKGGGRKGGGEHRPRRPDGTQ